MTFFVNSTDKQKEMEVNFPPEKRPGRNAICFTEKVMRINNGTCLTYFNFLSL